VPGSVRARDPDDPFDLARFPSAQEGVYSRALAEIRAGDRRSHWMWFLFPQVDGLGSSSTAKHYAIKSAEQARQFLAHPVLGPRPPWPGVKARQGAEPVAHGLHESAGQGA
jgi:uncharacterized protein (DUF1810 family)